MINGVGYCSICVLTIWGKIEKIFLIRDIAVAAGNVQKQLKSDAQYPFLDAAFFEHFR